MAHGRDHAEVAAAAAERPEQLVVAILASLAAVTMRPSARTTSAASRLSRGEAEAADQRPIAPAQGQARHADGPHRAGHRRAPEGIGDDDNVRGARPAQDPRLAAVGTDHHAAHAAQVEDQAVAQGAARPVVPPPRTEMERPASRAARIACWISCGVRQWAIARGGPARGSRPDRRRGGVARAARRRQGVPAVGAKLAGVLVRSGQDLVLHHSVSRRERQMCGDVGSGGPGFS